MPQHRAILDAKSLEGRHHGQATCRDYRGSVLNALPHRHASAPKLAQAGKCVDLGLCKVLTADCWCP